MKLTREQIGAIQKEVQAYKSVAAKFGQAAVELWQARIDVAIATGQADSLDDFLDPGRVAWGNDNCKCPGARSEIGDVVER